MLTTITLGGHLGRRFGRAHRFDLDVPSPAEAVRALCAVRKGFKAWVLEHSKPGYHVFAGRRSLPADDLGHPTGSSVIHIMPALAGAKSDLLQIIEGAGLIAAGIVTGALTDWTGIGLLAAKGLIGLGVGLAIGGVARSLASQPPPANAEGAGADVNYVFSGPVNVTGIGHPVPIVYGTLEVGSQVVSASISQRRVNAKDNTIAYDDPLSFPGPVYWHFPNPVRP